MSAPSTDNKLIRAHCLAAFVSLLLSVAFGLLVSLKMHTPELAATQSWLTWGRLRYNHTQGIFFGWLGNAFLMFLYYAVPAMAGRSITSSKLGWWLFALWNVAVLMAGWLSVMLGMSQPLEWAEFPLVVDAFVVAALLLMIVQFVVPLLRAKLTNLYVTAWYILGAIVFTSLAYPVGNIVPQILPGAMGAAFSGLWIHDAIGLWVTPLALAIAYLVIPAITRRPIYSHFLSMLGFWLLFFVYPLNGTHHYVFSAIPMEAQHVAILASALLGVDVILVVSNLLLSLRGCGDLVRQDTSLRFIGTGVILYLIVSIQGSLQAFMPVNKLVHFSDWVIGHSHLAMLGFATFTAIGGMAFVWKKIPGNNFSEKQLRLAYWHLLAGLVLMVTVLSISGLHEANLWQSNLPWMESVRVAGHYWALRSLSAIPIILGILFLGRAFLSAEQTQSVPVARAPSEEVIAAVEPEPDIQSRKATKSSQALSMAYAATLVAGVGFFAVSFLGLAVIPGRAMQEEVEKNRPATMLGLTDEEEQGRLVYAREGCAYCHTQQVRKVAADVARFGASTKVWETVYDYPQLWGTRRVGPDLAREAKVRTDDWHYAHLADPRSVVPDSVMPSYAWLFERGSGVPTAEARALLAYVKSLGRQRDLAGFGAPSVPSYCLCPEEVKLVEQTPVPVIASASMAMPDQSTRELSDLKQRKSSADVNAPPSDSEALKRGADLFGHNCAGCHGTTGQGNGPAADKLLPPPADLTNRKLSQWRLDKILRNGVYGSSMPAWRDLPAGDLMSLKIYVQKLASNAQPQDNPQPDAPQHAQIHPEILFTKNCASCHGIRGGVQDSTASGTMFPRPTDFTQEQPTRLYALKVINEGVPGTSMPPWESQLSLQEREALATYVCSLFGPEASRQVRGQLPASDASGGANKP